MEEILQSVKREMGEDHALYVNNQLQDAIKRSRELQVNLPDYSNAVDPFVDMPPLEEKNANPQVKDQVGSALSPVSAFT